MILTQVGREWVDATTTKDPAQIESMKKLWRADRKEAERLGKKFGNPKWPCKEMCKKMKSREGKVCSMVPR